MQQAFARLRYARISAQKARLVADTIRGLAVEAALDKLGYDNKKAAAILKKLLESAVANAENNHGLDIDELLIAQIYVDKAPSYKRSKPRAKGRANRIEKQNCHITVAVSI